ncbi:MAG: hypothetical protein ACRCY9_05900 [Phycicoccus sp.]
MDDLHGSGVFDDPVDDAGETPGDSPKSSAEIKTAAGVNVG